jgi:subtilisin family serine protease
MFNIFQRIFSALFIQIIFIHFISAQVSTVDSLDSSLLNWYNQDFELDQVPGTSTERVYREIIKGRESKKTVVVAIIDSGVDIYHKDLAGKIWNNEGEIEWNQLDDDGNGYIDDIHGWNFIGNGRGENIQLENFEYTRIYKKYNSKFASVSSKSEVAKEEEGEYVIYRKSKELYEENLLKSKKEQEGISMFEEIFLAAKEMIMSETGVNPVSLKDLKSIKTKSKKTAKAISFLIDKYKMGLTEEKLNEYKNHTEECLDKHLNVEFNPREIIGDNPTDITDTQYGNNDVKGPRSDHGTSVAGVVAANRNNGIGINGIADNVKLMILRTVPQGDEYDKDVALAIKYAVNNGANIINMSFGKEMSPNKEFVDEAVKYAAKRNVLLINSSGNNGLDMDKTQMYPTDVCNDGTVIESWINVGASTKYKSSSIAAEFSNYGEKNVDIFAPGKDIISLEPGNLYGMSDGTSLSSPIVTGVAALVWSYYPDLSAVQLKEILLESSYKIKKGKILVPDLESEKRPKGKFSQLSVSGGIINAYEAMKMAEGISK